MNINDKKRLAAIMGVIQHIKANATAAPCPAYIPTIPTPWAASGRQTMMANRNLMQRRAIRR